MAFLEKMSIATITDVYRRYSAVLDGRKRALLRWTVVPIPIAALLVSWASTIQRIPANKPVAFDAWQNLTLAYNLSHHGVMSLSRDSAHLIPSSRREPLPVFFLALHMASVQSLYGDMTLHEYERGLGTGRLKVSNVFWAALLGLSVFASIARLSASFLLAGAGTLLANTMVTRYFNDLLTQPHAAALLTLACYLSIVALSRPLAWYFGLAGVCFAMLALTKAAAAYVVIVLALLLFVWSLWQRRWPAQIRYVPIAGVTVFVLGFSLTTGTWMLRNYVLLDSMEIVGEAAPIVLMVRAEKNKMSWTEYRGSFYAWVPTELLRKATGSMGDVEPS